MVQACTGDEIEIDTNGENCVVVANRVFGTIDDNSGTSTVMYNDLGTATCTVTGTLADGCNESDIVAGGETLILTLANAVWQNPLTDALFEALLSGDLAEANSWNNEEGTIMSGAVARTSDTVVTITLAAAAAYSISGNETVSLANLAGTVLGSEDSITPDVVDYVVTQGA